ncbi:hypothetical protein R1sor_022064 [Riccia sorocarpa]|uniref:Uncharacterized protein n=1 Tax=Riccia sorocarpa TaxID=122646 RepID=A0ABD3GIS9_9MARC
MEEYEYLSGGEWSEGSAEGSEEEREEEIESEEETIQERIDAWTELVHSLLTSISSCCCQEKRSKIEFTRENIERSGGSCRPYKTGRDVCIVL